MTVSELLSVINNASFVRILQAQEVKRQYREYLLIAGYRADFPPDFNDETVKKFRCKHDMCVPDYEKRGLLPPEHPDVAPTMYYKDFHERLYYDIFI